MGRLRSNHNHPATSDYGIDRTVLLQASNYFMLIGVLAGSTTNPPALAYSNDLTSCDAPAVGYATVYPLTMFLRVLTAQILILSLG